MKKKYYKWLHQHIININNKIKTMGGGGGGAKERKKRKKEYCKCIHQHSRISHPAHGLQYDSSWQQTVSLIVKLVKLEEADQTKGAS